MTPPTIFSVMQREPSRWWSAKELCEEMNIQQNGIDRQLNSLSYWLDTKLMNKSYEEYRGGFPRRLYRLKPCFWKKGVKP